MKPILFSAPMVRAILNGTKTQTRRIVKLNSSGRVQFKGKQWHPDDPEAIRGCPKGGAGDGLWVQETWRTEVHTGEYYKIGYRATDTNEACRTASNLPEFYRLWDKYQDHWRPSIFMPRWASRITLEIVSVHIERLQDITEQDAEAEGSMDWWNSMSLHQQMKIYNGGRGPKAAYQMLWESINGPESWAANPLVWVIEFRKIN